MDCTELKSGLPLNGFALRCMDGLGAGQGGHARFDRIKRAQMSMSNLTVAIFAGREFSRE
jgi:hypothetical protein